MTKTELKKLKRLRKLLEMAPGDFSPSEGNVKVLSGWRTRDFPGEVSIRDLVVFETEHWRRSWILPVLDEIIAKYEARQK